MKNNKMWSTSLICSDIFSLKDNLDACASAGMDYLHFDVMDGKFVPRLGMYPEMLYEITSYSDIPVDVHLMVDDPEFFIPILSPANPSIITFHSEAVVGNMSRVIESIKKHDIKVGVGLNPATNFDVLRYVWDDIDAILIMGINPGILHQQIKPFIYHKIQDLKNKIASLNKDIKIIIDGGVNLDNASDLFDKGADILIGGSQTVFKNDNNIECNLGRLKTLSCV
jgi:ribulose-phosphate 3-epimerase